MELFPAIDLRGGRCVRLYQGDFRRETVYGDDPAAQAARFADAGCRWIHVVDLDAARTGEPLNRAAIAQVVATTRVQVQAGGGVRDDAAAEALFDLGVARVVVGTAALEDPALLRRLAARHPGAVALGLDARGGEVAVRGWAEGSGRDVVDVARELGDAGVAAVIVTEIGRDGTLQGPDVDGLTRVLAAVADDVVASGGVASASDLRYLAALEGGGRRLAGAIVGRALYDGALTVEDALAACRA